MSPAMISGFASQRAFFGVCALLFAISTAVTILWCASMSTMCGMPMPGGWTLSMPWIRMPNQTWFDATASFVGMWSVMMIAMMLPSLMPMLWRYRQRVFSADDARLQWLTVFVGCGYFFVWIVVGVIVFVFGITLAQIAMQVPALARAMPMLAGIVVLIAGLLQFSAWKMHQLACCRPRCGRGWQEQALQEQALQPDIGSAWRHGLRLGLHCCYCCAGLTAILLVVGVMDLQAMAIVAAAITLERLAPAGEQIARGIGVVVVATGLFVMMRAAGVA